MKEEGTNEILEQVTAFARRAHGEQKRKYSDDAYIGHPIRVMQICQQQTDDIAVLTAALLHDVLEDTHVSEEEIRAFLDDILSPVQTINALRLINELTDQYTKKNYPALNRKARREKEAERLAECSVEAQTIKYADLIDNALNITDHDPDFARVFLKESSLLLSKMNKGDERLYHQALAVVEEGLKKLKEKQPINPI